jgi:hypothetical protein
MVPLSEYKAHYDYYSLVLGYWGVGDTKRVLRIISQRWNAIRASANTRL